MISVFRWRSADRTGEWLDCSQPEAIRAAIGNHEEVVWIDLADPTTEEVDLVFKSLLPVHPLSLEDITRPSREPDAHPHFPKVEEFPNYLFVITNPLRTDPQPAEAIGHHRRNAQLSAVLTRNTLITTHYGDLACINDLHSYLQRHSQQCERGPDYLFHLVLDSMVDEYGPTLDRLSDRLEETEDEVFLRPNGDLLSHLLAMKRTIVALRKTLVLEREVLARLIRGEFELIDDREIVYYRNVYDHLVRYSELIEAAREMVTDLMQTHLAAVSNKLNQIMKTLTMISTVVLPMSLVAGIYGMNFRGWFPELDWKLGYPFALALMLGTGLGGYLWFRKRQWI